MFRANVHHDNGRTHICIRAQLKTTKYPTLLRKRQTTMVPPSLVKFSNVRNRAQTTQSPIKQWVIHNKTSAAKLTQQFQYQQLFSTY